MSHRARAAIVASLLFLGCDRRGDAPTRPSTSSSTSAQSTPPAGYGSLTITMNGVTSTVTIDGAAMFDMDDGVGINLISNCPGAPGGCGVAPGGGPVTPLAYGCPQGKFVMLHFHAPREKLAPGTYTQDGAIASSVAMIWLESGDLQLSADNWTNDVCTLKSVGDTRIEGVISARFPGGSLAVEGDFAVPVCR